MSTAIYMATRGALAYQKRLEVLANNLSNINTVGFKEDKTAFRISGSPKSTEQGSKETSISGKPQNFPYYLPFWTKTDFSAGQLKSTGNPLDLALEGDGFFCVETPEGVRYTRKGVFTLNQDGVLVTQEGLPVLGRNGRIYINGQDIIVDVEGNITVDGNPVDSLKIVDFNQPYALEKVGNTLFAPADPSVTENRSEGVKVRQGFIELSNVDAINVMTEMIDVMRGYESYQKVIQFLSETTWKTINEVGRLE